MRGSGALVVFALVGVSAAFTVANGACTYSSTGQGGDAAALEPYDAALSGLTAADGSFGTGSGGFSDGSAGSTRDSTAPPASCATSGDCTGVCCGTSCCPSGSTCCGSGNACCTPPTCANGETTCPNGIGCCPTSTMDSAPPPIQCAPEPPNFAEYCVAYYGGVNQGGNCSACLEQEAQTCATKQPNCTLASCQQRCDLQLGCTNGCATDAYCACIFQCESPNAADVCCGPPIMSLFMCAGGPCQSACATPADAAAGG